ncbi:MAG: nucleoside-diphosphate kinase [Clostridiales bacterium GWE2_32_10]|nr:MAG: nucleoside-diphosphate kinase [Clostridiales bacterium GWE2_32_10]HBY21216.1 nucleoside-diphosphate kinase [Clostridiales bacterium]
MERTYVMLKPDAVKRGLIGEVISKIEKKGLKITNIKMMTLTEEILREHYAHHANKPFFGEIVEFMLSAPVVPMIVEGEDAIKKIKMLFGPTKWFDAQPGTLRGDFATGTMENLSHCTDPADPEGTAEIEIKRFFGENA